MRLEATRENKPFAERIAIFTKYIEPFKQMWPFYWLKVAAIRDPQTTTWRLRYFSLVGRWSEHKPIQELWHTDSAILAVSQQIDAATAWCLLVSLQTSGAFMLESLPNVIIEATPEPDTTIPSASYWQESLSFSQSRVITEVTEPAKWLYLYISDASRREIGKPLAGEEKYIMDTRIRAAVQDDVDLLGLNDFAHFCSTYLGLGYNGHGAECSIDDFFYQFNLPLAFRVEREAPDRAANTLPLVIYCQQPLTLEKLEVRAGERWLPNAEMFPVTVEVTSAQGGWSVGKVIVPYTCGKVWFTFSTLDRPLAYEIVLPTREDQLTDVLGSLYQANAPGQGLAKWRKQLLESDGTNFEIALLNALTRLGMPVFFAGQIQQEAGTGGGGTSTAGYDLIVLEQATRRVVLISAKGSPRVPNDEVFQKLLDAVASVQRLLPGWSVQGVIACHTPNNKLVRLKAQDDFKVWGYEDLERIGQADSREAITSLFYSASPVSLLIKNR